MYTLILTVVYVGQNVSTTFIPNFDTADLAKAAGDNHKAAMEAKSKLFVVATVARTKEYGSK